MEQYHEPPQELSKSDRDSVRALASLKEEIEAIDWYHQRLRVTNDKELASIIRHNMEEEMEHAAMGLEWLRRNMDGWNEPLQTYLFTKAPILELEEEDEGDESD